MDLETELRRAIERDGRSLYRLALDCGVDVAVLQRFTKRQRTITLRTAARIARALGLVLRPKHKRKATRKRRR